MAADPPPLLAGTEDDDDRPYTVPDDATTPCPRCRAPLTPDAATCPGCGYALPSRKPARRPPPVRRRWAEGWPFHVRLSVMACCLALNAAAFWAAYLTDAGAATVLGIAPQAALQALVLGTWDTLTVRRTPDGRTTLTRVRRVAFVPLGPAKLNWKASHQVGVVATHGSGAFTWGICAYLTVHCVVPGVLFYWFVIRPARFAVVGCDVYGATDETFFRTTNREQAADVVRVIADCTGLVPRPVM